MKVSHIRELEKAVTVSGICLGLPEEDSGKFPGKIAGKLFRESQNATSSGILGSGKCFFEIDSSLLEFF